MGMRQVVQNALADDSLALLQFPLRKGVGKYE